MVDARHEWKGFRCSNLRATWRLRRFGPSSRPATVMLSAKKLARATPACHRTGGSSSDRLRITSRTCSSGVSTASRSPFAPWERQPIGVVALDQDTGFRVLDRLSVFESTIAMTDPEGAEANASHLRIMGSSRFAPWPETTFDRESWARVYVEGEHAATPLAKLPYHTLPYSFERNRFMVPGPCPPGSTIRSMSCSC